MSMKLFFILSLFLVVTSCGKPENLWPMKTKAAQNIEPANPEQYSYELKANSCTTGKHEFESFTLACEALKNHELNNDCALAKREELFVNAECFGDFS